MRTDFALAFLSCGIVACEVSTSAAQTITLQGDVTGTGTMVGSVTTVTTSVNPSDGYLDVGLNSGSHAGVRIGQLASDGSISAAGTAANVQLDVRSHGNRGVYMSSDSVGTLGGFVTPAGGTATNYLTIAPGGPTQPVQLISNSTGTNVGNVSIAANPLDIGGQLTTPRLNMSGAGQLPITWGALSSSGGTILNTPDPTNNPLWINESANGTTAMGSIGYFGFNSIAVTDNLTNLEPGPASALAVTQTYGGATFQGGRSALLVWLDPTQQGTYSLGTGAASSFFGAATFVAGANTSAGGTASNCISCSGGALFGINPTVSLSSGATNWRSLGGEEIDVAASGTNTSFVSKTGLSIVLKAVNTLAGGGGVDTAIAVVGSTQASAGWNYGLVLGGLNGNFPFQAGSTLIYGGQPSDPTYGQSSAGWGIDMLGPYFSNGFARSTGFLVDGAGNLTAESVNVGNFSVSSTAAGLTIAAPAQKATVTGTLAVINPTSTQYWNIGDKALTAYGGLYEVYSQDTDGGAVSSAGKGGVPGGVTLTLVPNYNGAVCSTYASYTGTITSAGTLQTGLTNSVIGTCTVLPVGGTGSWPVTSSDGSLTGATVNVPLRVNSVIQLVADVTQSPPPAGTSVLGTQTNCITSPTGTVGLYRMCGAPLQLPLSFGAANDIVLGSNIGTASAATGFTHPFPLISSAPTGVPVNPGVACAWNTSSHVLNCYDGTQWYHIPGLGGAG